jgi:hypothetical protein
LDNLLYLEKHKVLLKQNGNNGYLPIAYNVIVNSEGYEGVAIDEGDIIFDWMLYIKKSMQYPSKKNNKMVEGNLYAWQWGLSIEFINDVINFTADIWDISVSRQSGNVLPF